MNVASPVIAYADLPERWGVSRERGPNRLRITIPPVPGWRHLGPGFVVSFAVIAAWIDVMILVNGRWAWLKGGADWHTFLIYTSLFSFILIVMAAWAWPQLRQRAVLEVDARVVRLTLLAPRRVIASRAWSRSLVADVRYNRSNGKLLLVITARDLVDVHVSPSRDVTEWVAREVNEALRSIPAVAHAAQVEEDGNSTPMPYGPARTMLVTAALVIALLGVVALVRFGLVAIYVFALAGIPAGIALDSQKKQFWF